MATGTKEEQLLVLTYPFVGGVSSNRIVTILRAPTSMLLRETATVGKAAAHHKPDIHMSSWHMSGHM